jgi:hypothetical protein
MIQMKILRSIIPVFVLLLAVTGCNRIKTDDAVYCVQLDPLEKVFKEQLYFVENGDTAAVAKGETASFQWVFRSVYPVKNLKIEVGDLTSGNQRIPANLKAFVGYVKAPYKCHTCGSEQLPQRDFYDPVSDLFPDPLPDIETIDVSAMSNQPVWVSYTVPRDAPGGVYTADVTLSGEISGQPFSLRKQVAAKVYDVTLPEQTLWVTNWHFPEYLHKMNGGQPVEPYSERYWELLKALANTMRDHGQNTYLISPLKLCDVTVSGTQYTFDFTHFDEMVELFIREGNLRRIEGEHIATPARSQVALPNVHVPAGNGVFKEMTIDNDTARIFLSQFIPALFSHLKGKGWERMYLQHLSDEPNNPQSYNELVRYVKTLEPDMKVIEATILADKVGNSVDIHVPIIWSYQTNEAFYKAQQEAGKEVWYYISCDDPQGKYANRFYERELIQTRLLHWFNYRYHITGYLHWGLNYWMNVSGDASLYFDNESGLPSGDVCIVYPEYGKVYGSIRFETMRDGIADYELLKLLEKKDPAKAAQLAGSIIRSYDRYDTDIALFRAKRVKLLEWLSE